MRAGARSGARSLACGAPSPHLVQLTLRRLTPALALTTSVMRCVQRPTGRTGSSPGRLLGPELRRTKWTCICMSVCAWACFMQTTRQPHVSVCVCLSKCHKKVRCSPGFCSNHDMHTTSNTQRKTGRRTDGGPLICIHIDAAHFNTPEAFGISHVILDKDALSAATL